MAGLVKTYTGDLTQSVAKRIYEAALVGDEYRQDAKGIIDPVYYTPLRSNET